MREEEALLRTILDNPEEDAPRLIFADWLDERNQPGDHDRAEFIRTQIERRGLADDHAKAKRFRQTERALLHLYESTWIGDLAGLRGSGENRIEWEFQRGFPTVLTTSVPGLLQIPEEILNRHPFRELRIRGIRGDLELIGLLAKCRFLNRIQTLRLVPAAFREDGLGDEGLAALLQSACLVNLRVLDLERQRLGNRAIDHLTRSPLLRLLTGLRLGCNRPNSDWPQGIDADGLSKLLDHLGPGVIEELDFEGLELGLEGADALAHAAALVRLRSLGLHRCGLGSTGVQKLSTGAFLGALQQLDLRGNRISVRGAQALANSRCLTQLRSLDLSNNRLTDVGVQSIAESPNFAHLHSLSLRRNRLGDATAQAIALSSVLKELERLDLRGNAIRRVGARALGDKQHLPKLRLLDLRGNSITNTDKKGLREALGPRFGRL